MPTPFLIFVIDSIEKIVFSVAARSVGEAIKDARTGRKMKRLVGDAVDRLATQVDEYLAHEGLDERRREILLATICKELQPIVDDPARLFGADLEGQKVYSQLYPDGIVPAPIRSENLEQFYALLFPQIAHFVAGSSIALEQWKAEGFREEFRRLREIAEEISAVSAKITAVGAKVDQLVGQKVTQSEKLLRDFTQTLLNQASLRLDLSPLRADRQLHGTLQNHFVAPAFRPRVSGANFRDAIDELENQLGSPGMRVVLHGGPGAGKSTWSLWFQHRLLQQNSPRLAVVVRLRARPAVEERSLVEILQSQAGPHLKDAIDIASVRNWQNDGRLVVVLDGFDEIEENRRDAVEKWLLGLDAVVGNGSIVVTSRPLQSGHLETLPKTWRHMDLLPFDQERIVEFIERWHKYLPASELDAVARAVDASQLAEIFTKDPSLRPLAETPLMLGTLLFVHHRDGSLPSGRVNLYERYIAAMLGLRDSGLGIKARATRLNDSQKRQVLSNIALHFHLGRINELDDANMEVLVKGLLEKFHFNESPELLLAALRERSGLIIGPGAWAFVHKTVGEFLVAELIQEGTTFSTDGLRIDRERLWQERFNDAWTTVLFFWAGKTSRRELEEFLERLLVENSPKGGLLSLGILHDQGERLNFETRRSIAKRVIRGEVEILEDEGSHYSAATTPGMVPELFYFEITAPDDRLPGLTDVGVVEALEKLFTDGVLDETDLAAGNEHLTPGLTIALLWSFGIRHSTVSLQAASRITSVPAEKLGFLVLSRWFSRHLLSGLEETAITECLELFPSIRPMIPLIIAGEIAERMIMRSEPEEYGVSNPARIESEIRACLLLLLKWEHAVVDEDWLRASVSCHAWGPSLDGDILDLVNDALDDEKLIAPSISAQQRQDLLSLCQNLKVRRQELGPLVG